MTLEAGNKQELKDEKKPTEVTPLEKEEIEALKAYAMGMISIYESRYFSFQ